jgi:hypothetical protein
MVRSERESTMKIARFGGLKPLIPAISNAAATGKLTPAQSLRALFTDDAIVLAIETGLHAVYSTRLWSIVLCENDLQPVSPHH